MAPCWGTHNPCPPACQINRPVPCRATEGRDAKCLRQGPIPGAGPCTHFSRGAGGSSPPLPRRGPGGAHRCPSVASSWGPTDSMGLPVLSVCFEEWHRVCRMHRKSRMAAHTHATPQTRSQQQPLPPAEELQQHRRSDYLRALPLPAPVLCSACLDHLPLPRHC